MFGNIMTFLKKTLVQCSDLSSDKLSRKRELNIYNNVVFVSYAFNSYELPVYTTVAIMHTITTLCIVDTAALLCNIEV